MVPFKLTICGVDELPAHKSGGVSHILSILPPDYPVPEIFFEFDDHHRLDLRFDDIIDDLPGALAPSGAHIDSLLAFGHELDVEPAPSHLLVHCQMGISRSTAAMTLLLAQSRPGRSGTEIIDEIHRIRPQAWPNLRMVQLGDERLGRGGELVEAVRRQYRRRAEADAASVRFIHQAGRLAEVEGLEEFLA